MCWVAIDRGLRLADKRCLPCPNRLKWLENRDNIYEEIQEKGYNKQLGFFSQVCLKIGLESPLNNSLRRATRIEMC